VLFVPVKIRLYAFFDALGGKLVLLAALPFGVKKTVVRGVIDDGELKLSFLNGMVLPVKKKVIVKNKEGKRRVRKKTDVPTLMTLIRRLGIKNLRVGISSGGDDYTKELFLNALINNFAVGFSDVIKRIFNIEAFSFNILTVDKPSLKGGISLYFDMYVFKLLKMLKKG
jgi:hypothetical protein